MLPEEYVIRGIRFRPELHECPVQIREGSGNEPGYHERPPVGEPVYEIIGNPVSFRGPQFFKTFLIAVSPAIAAVHGPVKPVLRPVCAIREKPMRRAHLFCHLRRFLSMSLVVLLELPVQPHDLGPDLNTSV